MIDYIILLRGINVSGKNKIKMAELSAALEQKGFSNVQTYIQSGNIVTKCHMKVAGAVSRLVEKVILDSFGLEVPAIAFTPDEFKLILDNNPYIGKVDDLSKLHVLFLWDSPDDNNSESILSKIVIPSTRQGSKDQFTLTSRAIYLYLPDGAGKTKLTNTFFESKLKVTGTGRNWRTCNTLKQMIEA